MTEVVIKVQVTGAPFTVETVENVKNLLKTLMENETLLITKFEVKEYVTFRMMEGNQNDPR